VVLDEYLRGLVHHPRAAVVAETAPGGQDVGFFRLGKGGYGGEQGEETRVVVEDRSDPGLLEHDLGDPDAVGVGALPPREITGVGVEPGQQGLLEFSDVGRTGNHSLNVSEGAVGSQDMTLPYGFGKAYLSG
jgi:hypothetical protein